MLIKVQWRSLKSDFNFNDLYLQFVLMSALQLLLSTWLTSYSMDCSICALNRSCTAYTHVSCFLFFLGGGDLAPYTPLQVALCPGPLTAHYVSCYCPNKHMCFKIYSVQNSKWCDTCVSLQTFNQDYKDRVSALSNMVLVKFLQDTMVQPKESEVHPYRPYFEIVLSITLVANIIIFHNFLYKYSVTSLIQIPEMQIPSVCASCGVCTYCTLVPLIVKELYMYVSQLITS